VVAAPRQPDKSGGARLIMPRAPSKKFLDRKARVDAVLPILKRTYPAARCSLDYRTPLQLLIATILSGQCTDVRVNLVTKTLF
jgi:hypothetical protein